MRKNHLVSPEKMAAEYRQEDARDLATIYTKYQISLKEANAVDFDDLLNSIVELLADHEDLRFQYQNQFEHVIVDEYQDTNEPQDIITRTIASPHDNLCVVGDDDQSIYRWRGAQFKNILELPKVYPNLAVVRLEQNYRSTPNILAAAKSVITNNKDRHEKDLWTERNKGEPIRILATDTEEDEAIQVVQLISKALREGVAPSEIGVLYRTNAQSRVIEESLLREQIPYRIVGGFAFYQRREVKVLLSYMKMLVHPHDDLSFLRIVNNPRRGIGQTTLRQLQAKAGSLKISLFEAAKNAADHKEIGSGGARKLQDLCAQIGEWGGTLEKRSLAETLSTIVEDTNYEKALLTEDKIKGAARVENVGELITAFLTAESQITYEMYRPWDTENAAKKPTRSEKLEVFLERATLQSSRDEDLPDEDAVSLMTLHSAKGLEFERVFITGVEEGLFPHEQSTDSLEELEEERRLCYVGMTRAKNQLTLSFAHNRRMWGSSEPTLRSRFLDEISPDLVEEIGVVPQPQTEDLFSFGRSRVPPFARNKQRFPSAKSPRTKQTGKRASLGTTPSPGQAIPPAFLRPGKRVKHRTFGVGKVLSVEGEAPAWRVTVDFRLVGPKTLIQKYAKLEPA